MTMVITASTRLMQAAMTTIRDLACETELLASDGSGVDILAGPWAT